MRLLARVLDGYFIDPLIGLILPGAGDILGSLLGFYAVIVAIRRKVSPVVIARMVMNLGIDTVIGSIPLVGDLFDFGFKANKMNVKLLTERAGEGGKATVRDWAVLIGAFLAFVIVTGFVVWGVVSIFRRIM